MSPVDAITHGRRFGLSAIGAFANQVLALATSLIVFAILARRFGLEQLGAYSAALALVAIVGPLFEFGCNHLSVYRYSLHGDTESAWGENVGTHLLGGLALALVALAIQPLVNAQFDRRYFAILLWSELALGGTVFGATTLLEATERVFEASRIRVAAAVNRLAAVSIFAWRSNWGLSDWVLLHLGFNALAVVATIAVLSSRLGVKTRPSVVPLREVRRGVALAGNQVATQGQSDADKLVLSMYRRDYDLGVYAAGYRVATLAALPLNTLLGITYGRFFVAGATSQLQARRLAIRMTKLGLLVTIPTSIILIIGAPLVPVVLGDDYAGSVVVIRVLAILPVVKSLQEFAGNALTGANRQGLRVRIVTTGLVVNVALNVALVPIWGWKAAAAGTFVAEIGVAAAFWRKVLD